MGGKKRAKPTIDENTALTALMQHGYGFADLKGKNSDRLYAQGFNLRTGEHTGTYVLGELRLPLKSKLGKMLDEIYQGRINGK